MSTWPCLVCRCDGRLQAEKAAWVRCSPNSVHTKDILPAMSAKNIAASMQQIEVCSAPGVACLPQSLPLQFPGQLSRPPAHRQACLSMLTCRCNGDVHRRSSGRGSGRRRRRSRSPRCSAWLRTIAWSSSQRSGGARRRLRTGARLSGCWSTAGRCSRLHG